MIHQLEKIARQPIPDLRTATGTLDYKHMYTVKKGKTEVAGTIIFLRFSLTESEAIFQGVDSTEFKESDAKNYLWQTYSANASPKFPTLQIFNKKDPKEKDPKDLYDEETGKISLATSKKAKKLHKCFEDFPALEPIAKKLREEQHIADELEKYITDKDEFLLSICIDDKMVGESPYFAEKKATMQGSDIKPEYFTDGKPHLAQNKLCSVTLEQTEVFGYASLYNFYAPKTYPSVVAGGFDSTQSWKNFPTSKQGVMALEKAKAFVEAELRFRFCGYDYFLLPTPVLNSPNAFFADIVKDFAKFALTNEAQQKASITELDIITALAEQQNTATYTLFFFEQNKAEFKILASIDDVFPSYMRRVYDARAAVESMNIFHNLPTGENEIYNLTFSFRLVKHFFPHTQHFLDIVRAVFMQKTIDYRFVLHGMMSQIRSSFAERDKKPKNNKEKPPNFRRDALKGYMLLCFLAKLNLLQSYSYNAMSKSVTVDAPIEAFFKEHEGFFDYDSPLKRALFLEGVLAQKLLNIQQVERGSQPFFARLNGLNINRKIFERILPEIHTKLTEYDKFYPNYRLLSEAISSYSISCTDADWRMTDDQYSFYFTLGMSLAKRLYPAKETDSSTTTSGSTPSNEENAQ